MKPFTEYCLQSCKSMVDQFRFFLDKVFLVASVSLISDWVSESSLTPGHYSCLCAQCCTMLALNTTWLFISQILLQQTIPDTAVGGLENYPLISDIILWYNVENKRIKYFRLCLVWQLKKSRSVEQCPTALMETSKQTVRFKTVKYINKMSRVSITDHMIHYVRNKSETVSLFRENNKLLSGAAQLSVLVVSAKLFSGNFSFAQFVWLNLLLVYCHYLFF